MKKIISIYGIMGSLLIAMLPGVSSCDKLEDELFKKNTYIIHNGWQDYSLEVADDNTTVLPVYFGVNGTSGNDKEIHITMEVDPDTLDAYNKDKYKSQTDLYYKILPEGTYTFDADSWNIKSGELNAAAYIHIDLNKIREVGNLYNDYVLPLRITSSTGEEIMKLFHELHANGNTIVLITHDNGVADEAERKIFIRDVKVSEVSLCSFRV